MKKPAVLMAMVVALVGCATPPPSPPATPTVHSSPLRTPEAAPEIGEVALAIALEDGRLEPLLARHSFLVEGVQPLSDSRADLFIRFEDEIPVTAWPDATCGIVPEKIDGVHWRIDLVERRVLAVSPRWGEQSCIIGGN